MVIGEHRFGETLRPERAFGDDDAPGPERPDLADNFSDHPVVRIDRTARYVAPAKIWLDQDCVAGLDNPRQTAGIRDGLGCRRRMVFAEAQSNHGVNDGGFRGHG